MKFRRYSIGAVPYTIPPATGKPLTLNKRYWTAKGAHKAYLWYWQNYPKYHFWVEKA